MTSTSDELKFYAQLASQLFTRSYDLHKIPGPPGQPVVGHIPKIMRPDYHVQMLQWADEYGGIFKFSLGCQWVVVVSDPSVAIQVLGRGEGAVPRKCVGYQFFDLATNHLGRRSFFTTTDEVQWAAVRKAAAPAFNHANVRRAFACVLKHAEGVSDKIYAKCSESDHQCESAAGHTSHAGPSNGHASPPVPTSSAAAKHQGHASGSNGNHSTNKGHNGKDHNHGASQQQQKAGWFWGSKPASPANGSGTSDNGVSNGVKGKIKNGSAHSTGSNTPGNGLAHAASVSASGGGPPSKNGSANSNSHSGARSGSSGTPAASGWYFWPGRSTTAGSTQQATKGGTASGSGTGIAATRQSWLSWRRPVSPRPAGNTHTSLSPSQSQHPTSSASQGNGSSQAASDVGAPPAANGGATSRAGKGVSGKTGKEAVGSSSSYSSWWFCRRAYKPRAGDAAGAVPTAAPVTLPQEQHGEAAQDAGHSTASPPAPAAAVVDIQDLLEEALLDVFVEALFDIDARDFPGHAVAQAMNLVLEEANERLKVPLRGLSTWLWAPEAWRKVQAAQSLLGEQYGKLADVVRGRRPPPEYECNMWACLGRIKDPRTGKPLSREALIPEIGALMMAGFDTSSHTIAWTLYALAVHPDLQADVREELARAGLLHGPGLSARDVAFDDLPRLPALNCVIDESMRLFPVAATASVREVVSPVKVGPYKLPPGVIVWPMLYALHNTRHNWDDPAVFKPERWYAKHYGPSSTPPPFSSQAFPGGDDSAVDTRAHAQGGGSKKARAFMPFSDGLKGCLGQTLGLMEVRTLLVTLLSRFHFQLDTAMGGAEQVIRNQIMSLTLKIKGGLRLRCIPLDHMPLESVLPTSCAHMAAAAAAHQLAPAGSLQQHSSAFSRASSLSASLPFPALASAFAAGSGGLAQMDRAPSFAPPPPPGLGLGAHAAAPGNAPALPPLGWPHVRYSAAAAEPSGAVSEPHTPPATSSGTSGTASGTPAGAAGARAGASPTSPPAGVGGSPVGSTTTTPSLLARLASGSFLSSPRSPVVSSSNQAPAKMQASRAASLPVHEEAVSGSTSGAARTSGTTNNVVWPYPVGSTALPGPLHGMQHRNEAPEDVPGGGGGSGEQSSSPEQPPSTLSGQLLNAGLHFLGRRSR